MFATACSALLAGLWISNPGLQEDEALFGAAIFDPVIVRGTAAGVPIMIMDYVGTLKAGIWALILRVFPPSIESIRYPAVLLHAVSLWLFAKFWREIDTHRSAGIALALLASDPMYLFTNRQDWGPVVLQHLLLALGLVLFVRAGRTNSAKWACVAGFVFGLGVWEKATFVWLIFGAAVAAAAAFRSKILHALHLRFVAALGIGLLAGASPFLYFNISTQGATLRSPSYSLTAQDLSGKALFALRTLESRGLIPWMTRQPGDVPPREPDSVAERLCLRTSGSLGVQSSLTGWLFVGAALAAPFLVMSRRQSRGVLFAATFVLAAWLAMVLMNGGGAFHHVVLLWPFPHFLIASALSCLDTSRWRPGIWVTSAAVVANLALINNCNAHLIRYGGRPQWSEAIYETAAYARSRSASAVNVMDWGVLSSIRLLTSGSVPVRVGYDWPVTGGPAASYKQFVEHMLAEPDAIYLRHMAGVEMLPGANDHFLKTAREMGYAPVPLQGIRDRQGQLIFEFYTMQRSRSAAP